jgi:hypothetical protein
LFAVGIDDPTEGNAPGMIFLALGHGVGEAVFRRQDFDAEENGFAGVGPLEFAPPLDTDIRYQDSPFP